MEPLILQSRPIYAHRAPDPAPADQPWPDPAPHDPQPQHPVPEDEPVPDHNPS